jgi:hypothetical protein
MRNFNSNQEIKLPFDSIDTRKNIPTNTTHNLNASLAFRLKKYSNRREITTSLKKDSDGIYYSESTTGMPLYMHSRSIKEIIEPHTLNNVITVKY